MQASEPAEQTPAEGAVPEFALVWSIPVTVTGSTLYDRTASTSRKDQVLHHAASRLSQLTCSPLPEDSLRVWDGAWDEFHLRHREHEVMSGCLLFITCAHCQTIMQARRSRPPSCRMSSSGLCMRSSSAATPCIITHCCRLSSSDSIFCSAQPSKFWAAVAG